ncbi:MAG TPA: hypothetical protein VE994_17870 [Terriglobales bacterium]|nr:hypothetical protein [Terriglobales bacterium]
MRRLILIFTMLATFSFFAVAQSENSNAGSSSGSQGASSSSQGTPPASPDMGAGQASKKTKEENASHHASGKETTLTGCLNAGEAQGGYTLVNHRYKQGVVVGGNDELPKHVGNEVKLTGHWASAKDIGEDIGKAPEQGKQMESQMKHFKVDSIQHISDTCKIKPGGTKKGSESGSSGR